MKPFALALAAALALVGCAFNRPAFEERTTATNGAVTIRKLAVPTWALWPATSTLGQQRASLGKTFSLGTSELSQESVGTNAVEWLRQVNSLLDKIPKPTP